MCGFCGVQMFFFSFFTYWWVLGNGTLSLEIHPSTSLLSFILFVLVKKLVG